MRATVCCAHRACAARSVRSRAILSCAVYFAIIAASHCALAQELSPISGLRTSSNSGIIRVEPMIGSSNPSTINTTAKTGGQILIDISAKGALGFAGGEINIAAGTRFSNRSVFPISSKGSLAMSGTRSSHTSFTDFNPGQLLAIPEPASATLLLTLLPLIPRRRSGPRRRLPHSIGPQTVA